MLAVIPEDEHGPRFQLLFFAAANAIEVLGDLDFTRYEIDEVAHSEGLWEAVAPTVEDTTNSVEVFLECIRGVFSVEISGADAVDDALDSWFEDLETRAATAEPPVTRSWEDQAKEVTGLLQAICDGLTHEMARFRVSLARLKVHPDRWLLLDHIAMIRGKLRAGIGAMVYLAARLFLDVTREEVVPAYGEDLDNAVLLRRELARLRDAVRMHHAAVERIRDEPGLRALLTRVQADLEAFFESRAWLLVRAADKRPLGSVRRGIRAVLASDSVGPDAAITFMEGLTRFLESLITINRREMLMLHDTAEIERIQELLASARTAAELQDREPARQALRKAFECCERLDGRDDHLDAVCRVLRHVELEPLTSLEIGAVVRTLEEALGAAAAEPEPAAEKD